MNLQAHHFSRRHFLSAASAGSLAAVVSTAIPAYGNLVPKAGKLAMLGGSPTEAVDYHRNASPGGGRRCRPQLALFGIPGFS